ncbi:complex I subunit 5 family protein [Parablautia intestinalis]|jgi:multicomponent Na+:H+ antiporter subunit D|uniref:complex I subunit 5 family protein n=1 Tax=Parablautia intestinalis TaxID=2320100 RepID=UPI0023C8C45F|nr:proton-conducting transporter membrane subunit [Parablautia intestinalis]MCI8615219.1 proton-conducting membrane transporter [Lachnospiraceae bacterium]MDE7048198.1 proton-conducting membrane transporter [Lachnospiraceae bacterium]
MIMLVILIPVIAGILVSLIPFKKRSHMETFLETLVILNSLLVWNLLIHRPESVFTLANFTGNLSISFKVDGMTMVFAGLVSGLWPFATLYAFEYMTKEKNEKIFFTFYTMTYGVTLGISLAGNLLTMYFFYELLTLVTVPLVMHTLTREAILASRKYLYYSLGGAAFAFIGLIFIIIYGSTTDFILGGVLDPEKIGGRTNVLLLIYVIAFMGFGVKAALCPFNSWLPDAGVAPTPVTALLHAVAVVKSGAFAIIRLTYFSFGVEFLRGTWAQNAVMLIVMFTIVYGCSRAVKETHIKRRLAYSTISNLSYILFGVTIMTPLGMVGALTHLVFHAVMKISSFFCAGAIMHQTDKHYVHELNGMGYKMPCVFGVFTVSSLALMGVPGLAGFVSKWNLASSAVESGNRIAYGGIACLLISALLTAIYMMTIVVRAFFPVKEFDDTKSLEEEKDPNWKMLVPLFVFTIFIVIFGLFSGLIVDFFADVAAGVY